MATTRHPISLAHLTVLDTTPPELVTVAAAAGFRTIGIRLTATPSVGIPPYDILREGPILRETAPPGRHRGLGARHRVPPLRARPAGRRPGKLSPGVGAARRAERAGDERRARRGAHHRAPRRSLRPGGSPPPSGLPGGRGLYRSPDARPR